eukprot:scaffold23205_cov99-Isochrysis_galbana.AAC.4
MGEFTEERGAPTAVSEKRRQRQRGAGRPARGTSSRRRRAEPRAGPRNALAPSPVAHTVAAAASQLPSDRLRLGLPPAAAAAAGCRGMAGGREQGGHARRVVAAADVEE